MNSNSTKKYLSWLKNLGIGLLGIAFASYIFYLQFGDAIRHTFSDTSPGETSLSNNTNVECQPVPVTLSDRTVILRVDDVQAYAWKETSFRIITDAEERGIPLTLGVIPKGLPEDQELVTFLQQHACNLEFALHGWDHGASLNHESPEFLHLNQDKAAERIAQGLSTLTVLSDEPIVTWVPPQNIHSTGTMLAVQDLGFKYISTEGEEKWDYDTTIFNYGSDELLGAETVVAACEKEFQTGNTCIIMVHPQNFTIGLDIDEKLYQEHYLGLLDELQASGYSFARFKDFSEAER